jgi:hypothetical protein
MRRTLLDDGILLLMSFSTSSRRLGASVWKILRLTPDTLDWDANRDEVLS